MAGRNVAAGGGERLAPHPDRLFPADPGLRGVARGLYESVAGEPIFSPHGHVEARLLLEDEPFTDAASLLVTPDHYVTRLLHSLGVGLDRLGLGGRAGDPSAGAHDGEPTDGGTTDAAADPREIWRTVCENWHAFLGTPSRYWLESELHDIFGVTVQPSAGTADRIFDQVTERLAAPELRPRALFESFHIETLATTDDPLDDLAAHQALRDDPDFTGDVVPTFRPDQYLDPSTPGWPELIARLGEATGLDTSRHGDFLDALRSRRRYFIEHGATATDHGVADTGTEPLPAGEAAALHAKALAGTITSQEAAAFRRAMVFEMARMSTEDGLVMQFHPGVLRNHHRPTLTRFGPDTGHDLPLPTSYSEGLRPLLEEFGTDPRFRMVLFTVDETSFSRDIAPLAGFYPSLFIGAPWWFLDAPEAIGRFRSAVTETAGFYKSAGFVDDTRAFCSIPARHDMSRRTDAAYLARRVGEHRITEDDARRVIHDLVVTQPRRVFSRVEV